MSNRIIKAKVSEQQKHHSSIAAKFTQPKDLLSLSKKNNSQRVDHDFKIYE